MNEKEHAIILANKILDRPWGDPDDDLAVLSRQLLLALERHGEVPPNQSVLSQYRVGSHFGIFIKEGLNR